MLSWQCLLKPADASSNLCWVEQLVRTRSWQCHALQRLTQVACCWEDRKDRILRSAQEFSGRATGAAPAGGLGNVEFGLPRPVETARQDDLSGPQAALLGVDLECSLVERTL